MTRDRLVLLVGGLAVVAAVAAGLLVPRGGDPGLGWLAVGWGGSEDEPCCVYDADSRTVEAELMVEASGRGSVTVTVTAYADENTSQPVGSGSRTVSVDGTVRTAVVVTVPVDAEPHVDEDGVVACRFSVDK